MYRTNIFFLEEFKRLDKLCRELYPSSKGVTSYIDDMKSTPGYDSVHIPGWDYDLKMLTKLRRARNHLSHDVDSFAHDMCTQDEIDWLISFRTRILNSSDPLTLLRKRKTAPQPKRNTTLPQKENPPTTPANGSGGCILAIILSLILALAVAGSLLRFWIM